MSGKTSGSNGDGGSRLLSKVVKFVKSPTTDWADLDRPPSRPEAIDSQSSRLALQEMIKRKRRNDFVRDRELDALRKLGRKQVLKDGDALSGQAFLHPGSERPANTDIRATTVKKIDVIEAQMASSWFPPQSDPQTAARGATTTAASAPAIEPASSDRGAAPPVAGVGASLPPAAAGPAFAPTEPMGGFVPDAEGERKDGPAPAAPLASSAAGAGAAGGGLSDFQVEVVADAKLDPALEEAAIRFANGDAAGAEAGLRALVADDGGRKDDVYTWLTLFDLYRVTGAQDKFDAMALHFAARFGRSAPQWRAEAGMKAQASVAPARAEAAAGAATRFHWSCPPAVNAKSVAALNAALLRTASPWRLDWRRLQTIEPEAVPALNEAFQRWAKEPVRIQFLGADSLLKVLADNAPADDRQVDPLWWQTRLALLRVQGEMDEFELVALNYCVTYEVSPPAWEAPKNSYSPITENGDVAAAPVSPAPATPANFKNSDQSPSDFTGGHAGDGVASSELAGTLLGSVDAGAFGRLRLTDDIQSIELNCRHLLRVDFGAAGDLLNWAMSQKDAGRRVSFKQVNRLVAAFFGVIGITDAARVVLRAD
jgi:ABC-type transporter Mla MlaB component